MDDNENTNTYSLLKLYFHIHKMNLSSSSRAEQATLLGYKDFAHMSMETKMAGSVENVLSMITSLLAKGT